MAIFLCRLVDYGELMSDHAKTDNLFLEASLAHAKGDLNKARQLCEQSLAQTANSGEALNLLGVVLCQLGEPAKGIVNIAQAAAIEPENAGYLNNLGTGLSALGRDHDALLSYQRVLEIDPAHATAHNNIATIYRTLGRLNKAASHYQQAIELRPGYGEAMSNYGNVLLDLGQIDEAAEVLEKAIGHNPDYEYAYNNLGIVRQRQGQYARAEEHFRKAISLSPGFADPYSNLAEVYKETGRAEEAVSYYRKSVELAPDNPSLHSNLLFALNNLNSVTPEALFNAHKQWDLRHAGLAMAHEYRAFDESRRIRVGYVSSDFRRHSVSYFFEPILLHHDPQKFEITCYSNGLIEDPVTERLRSLADHWRDIFGMSDEDAANLIKADAIDILVDLSGHTMGNRLGVFSRKPAPLQVSYLGYPATTGVSAIDYRLTDAWADPVGPPDPYHSEKLVRLAGCFLCYRAPDDGPDVGPLPALEKGYITFGSCNNLAKLTPEVIETWAGILQAVPGAKLLLKGKALGDAAVRSRYLAAFEALGIEAERLDLRSWISGPSHLAIYNHIDIALDPFPYNGTTTICETLWMGVPTISLKGARHAGRVGFSLNSAVGKPDLVADNRAEYCRLAVDLAKDTLLLQENRTKLRAQLAASQLCDGPNFTRSLEDTYRIMCREHAEENG